MRLAKEILMTTAVVLFGLWALAIAYGSDLPNLRKVDGPDLPKLQRVLGVIVLLNPQRSIIGAHAVNAYVDMPACNSALTDFVKTLGPIPDDVIVAKMCVSLPDETPKLPTKSI